MSSEGVLRRDGEAEGLAVGAEEGQEGEEDSHHGLLVSCPQDH